MGQSPPSSTYNQSADGLPFFQGKAEFGELHPRVRKYCSTPNKVSEAGATLLTVRAPVGPTNLADVRCCIGRGLAAIHPLDEVPEKFVLYLFRSRESEISGAGTGSTFSAINGDFLKNLSVNLPPAPEQHRIVAKIEELFSELDKGIENLKLARAQLAVYRQALLKHAFEGKLTADWREAHQDQLESADQLLARIREERDKSFEREMEQWSNVVAKWEDSLAGEKSPPKPQKLKPFQRDQRPAVSVETPQSWPIFYLDEIVISIGQGWSPKCEGFSAKKGNWGVIKTTAIQSLEFLGHENKQLPAGLYPRPWLLIVKDDILITRAGPRSRCGIVCRVKDSPEKLMLCDKAYRLRIPESVVSSGYMELLLNSTESSNRIEALKTGINDSGVNITQSGFLNLAFQIPPLTEQHEIQRILAEVLSVIDNVESDIETNLQKAEALRQSILKKAFAGELVPRDPADEPASVLLARIRAERATAKSATSPKQRGRKPSGRKRKADL